MPGSPWVNGTVESFNARLRDELLDGEIFYSLKEDEIIVESWRRHYNAPARIARPMATSPAGGGAHSRRLGGCADPSCCARQAPHGARPTVHYHSHWTTRWGSVRVNPKSFSRSASCAYTTTQVRLQSRSRCSIKWCCQRGLNSRPLHYQWSALPLSYGSMQRAQSCWPSTMRVMCPRRSGDASPGAGEVRAGRSVDAPWSHPPPRTPTGRGRRA